LFERSFKSYHGVTVITRACDDPLLAGIIALNQQDAFYSIATKVLQGAAQA
jgi:hypothetical protein